MPVSCPSCGFALNKENDTQCAICHNPLPSMGGGSASGNGPFGTQHEPRSEDTRQGDTVRSITTHPGKALLSCPPLTIPGKLIP